MQLQVESLSQQLAALKAQSVQKKSPERISIENRAETELKAQQLPQKGLKVGDRFPDFELPNAFGENVSLKDFLRKGSLVINFYRGNWCPYCNLELRALHRAMEDIQQCGANLLAISPETPDKGQQTIAKHELQFEVLSDTQNSLAKQIGIAYEIPDYLMNVYEKFGLNLKKHNASDKNEIPIPATYVVDKNGIVQYAFMNEDYTVRAEISEIIEAAKECNKQLNN